MTDTRYEEPLLQEDNSRFVQLPYKYPELQKMYELHESMFWSAKEIDYSSDLNDFENKLTDNERYFVENILAVFVGSDGIVLENLIKNFCFVAIV